MGHISLQINAAIIDDELLPKVQRMSVVKSRKSDESMFFVLCITEGLLDLTQFEG